MQAYLQLFMSRNLPPSFFSICDPLIGLAPKISDGTSSKRFMVDSAPIFKKIDDNKLVKGAWSYVYCRNTQESINESNVIANICKDNEIAYFLYNGEKHLFGVWGEPIVKEPDKNIITFVENFKKIAPNTALWYNGFSVAKIGERNAANLGVVSKFNALSYMCYSSLSKKSSAVKRATKYSKELPSIKRFPTVDIKAKGESLKDFVGFTNVDGLNVWCGNGGKNYIAPFMKWLAEQE